MKEENKNTEAQFVMDSFQPRPFEQFGDMNKKNSINFNHRTSLALQSLDEESQDREQSQKMS